MISTKYLAEAVRMISRPHLSVAKIRVTNIMKSQWQGTNSVGRPIHLKKFERKMERAFGLVERKDGAVAPDAQDGSDNIARREIKRHRQVKEKKGLGQLPSESRAAKKTRHIENSSFMDPGEWLTMWKLQGSASLR